MSVATVPGVPQRQKLVKTRVIATVGPASESMQMLRELVISGVDIFRLNFAHGDYTWLSEIVRRIRQVSAELDCPVGILGDLSGPKIRLGEIPGGEVFCSEGASFRFVRGIISDEPTNLTCTYEPLIDDVKPGDRILLADGTVAMVVLEKDSACAWVRCQVIQAGRIRSRQGVNLPGVALSTPSVTEKDRKDLVWALQNQLDFVGLSFVRQAEDIIELKRLIEANHPKVTPLIVAKIEKTEAIADLDNILDVTDAVMVARGDLGVEADISRVPILQKQIIRRCNELRIPVITATQMLDSMQTNELPTRAEVTDVANAVIDGTDAVMLSGETAIGSHPVQCVRMMERIAAEAEPLVHAANLNDLRDDESRRARPITEAVTRGAIAASEYLKADLIVVATVTGRTALALSRLRGHVPVLAFTDREEVARRMTLYWGVTPIFSRVVQQSADALLAFVVKWGGRHQLLGSGSKVIIVGHTNWLGETHDLIMVHVIP
ncbi:MAG TPA: pyruvate kinase [Planctomycetaceae bacterium]|nr:pyruvate kinase [Planctomycetaceae bacterium]HQZ64000.1 pyruvate kinase [Planctomycetaceae bacterium]HRA87033.1 pyruvate kinase [Planctomycetaceae bacterium]